MSIKERIESAKQKERENMREPVVKFYKESNNGAFATVTTAADADEFLRECTNAFVCALVSREGDHEFTIDALLPQICEIWAKLKGYKADSVSERRMLTIGSPNPAAHMQLLTGEPYGLAELEKTALTAGR